MAMHFPFRGVTIQTQIKGLTIEVRNSKLCVDDSGKLILTILIAAPIHHIKNGE